MFCYSVSFGDRSPLDIFIVDPRCQRVKDNVEFFDTNHMPRRPWHTRRRPGVTTVSCSWGDGAPPTVGGYSSPHRVPIFSLDTLGWWVYNNSD